MYNKHINNMSVPITGGGGGGGEARYNSLYVELSLAIILTVVRTKINIVYSYIPRCPFFVLICLFVCLFV